MNCPVKFLPFFKSTIWGDGEIAKFKGISTNCSNIGESWELSAVKGCESIVAEGNLAGMELSELVERYKDKLVGKKVFERFGTNFPLLIKFIDANADLSLQVHPDDEMARTRHNSLGKTEMWYILQTKPDAKIRTGLSKRIDADEYLQRIADNTLVDVVSCFDSAPGDFFYLPAGRIHAIGAGNLLVEIQESSDVTYRVYDYGRKDAKGKTRELHTQLAKDAIDFNCYDNYKTEYTDSPDGSTLLIDCRHFRVCREIITQSRAIVNEADSFMALICIGGEGEIVSEGVVTRFRQGDSLLIPATMRTIPIDGVTTLLTAVVP